MIHKDVIIIGAGAAGMMTGIESGKRSRNTLILEHTAKPGKKIIISGGGRCNFTNLEANPRENYLSENKHFCISAMKRYTQWDFLDLIEKHEIPYHEKKLGQQFCDNSAKDIVKMLLSELEDAGTELECDIEVTGVEKAEEGYLIKTSQSPYTCESLVIATGGLSIPKMGATNFAYKVAEQFGHSIIDPRPALVPFTLSKDLLERFSDLPGTSVDCLISCNGTSFRENILFTHRGLSGPAILQISSFWNDGDDVTIHFNPEIDWQDFFAEARSKRPKEDLTTLLTEQFTKRFVSTLEGWKFTNKKVSQASKKELEELIIFLSSWTFKPQGTEGYRTAEVTRGGVNTSEVSSKTMESQKAKGLYFVGEALDVTGWLGGFNFQWAWASGYAAGQVV